ncbi:GNAT family N-acetyltransferase [Halanaeroarchaeum sp. HSR-CO]|uniref:lipid II:glycine glycyltransferase FemX n=1 Tax=Halanaeroarchaeum sp. HSR-CO TaxID=2866382 RepID=UPI00217E6BEC|nr:GNAT family N-acetyltransferase [Halanaeroarchaeum sp. HSR-CO]
MDIERVDLDAWEQALPADGFEVFHTPEALRVLADHATGELQLYVGYKGDRPVGMLPVVVRERLGRAVVSPPPGMGIPRLGPLVMPASPKRRKRERVARRFTESVLDTLDASGSGTLVRIICPVSCTDPRPFSWEGLSVEPSFTYSLDTAGSDPDELLASFSKSLRREIRDAQELDVSVSVEGMEAARTIFERTRDRYREQDRSYSMEWPYVRDLLGELAEVDRRRVYVARDEDGEFLTGVTALYSNEAAYYWQGGARATYENVNVNSLVHWTILTDILEDPPIESVTRYDLVGANTERLCRYKSKFGADLEPYYVAETSGAGMSLAKRAYGTLDSIV